MDETILSPQYAFICSTMKNTVVHSKDSKSNTSFKSILLARCQKAFESIFTRKRTVAKERNEIESCRDKVWTIFYNARLLFYKHLQNVNAYTI
jgi:hypothetical protein